MSHTMWWKGEEGLVLLVFSILSLSVSSVLFFCVTSRCDMLSSRFSGLLIVRWVSGPSPQGLKSVVSQSK